MSELIIFMGLIGIVAWLVKLNVKDDVKKVISPQTLEEWEGYTYDIYE